MANETTYAGTISKIRVSDGNIYEIADKWARDQITAITGGSAVVFKGVSTTALTDGGNENPTVNGSVVTAKTTGDLYFVGNDEYIYGADQKWHWLGNQLGQLGDLAYKNSATATYTPAGSVSQPTFSGAASTVSMNYTPSGTVSKPTFSGTASTVNINYTPGGTVSKPTFSGTASTVNISYTPGGTVSQPTFNGTATTVSITYTPAGTVSKPNITVTNGTKSINYVTNVGSVPTWSSEVEDETLMFSFTQGSTPSTASVNATTSISASLDSAPTFSGTQSTLKGGVTPAGTVTQPTFSGTAATLKGGYTPAGTVSQPTFSGTEATLKGGYTPSGTVSQPTFTGVASTLSGSITPTGTVSQPNFSGTPSTITVS